MPDTPRHIIRVVGSYSLLTFFTARAQNEFFDLSTDPELEEMLLFDGEYPRETFSFRCDTDERDFELKMANHGFIREAFWKNSFPPIFGLKNVNVLIENCWAFLSNNPIQQQITESINNPENDQFFEALLYRYSIYKLKRELKEICQDQRILKIHIGLNKFGLINVGMTIEVERRESENFENLCRRVYEKVAHLQEDPLENLASDCQGNAQIIDSFLTEIFGNAANAQGVKQQAKEKIRSDMIAQISSNNPSRKLLSKWEARAYSPRLIISYFQVLAITTIHQFLFEKLDQFGKNYWDLRWRHKINKKVGKTIDRINWERSKFATILNKPWLLSNQVQGSLRKGLPPLRHVVFMYQLVHGFHRKQSFLSQNENKRALLTLGHNVGWSPSWNRPFPLFEDQSNQVLLADSSLLENSCCLIFPQGLVVVTPPNNTMYLGGVDQAYFEFNPHYSPSYLPYEEYWELIFKLFIRVVETRLLLGMINRYLSDCHKDFIVRCRKNPLRRMMGYFRRILPLIGGEDPIYGKLIRIGWLLQRISENVVTPEVSRFSFVRKKIIGFMEGVHFDEFIEHIEAEFLKLNKWLNEDIITIATVTAIFVATFAIIIGLLPDEAKNLFFCGILLDFPANCNSIDNVMH